MTLGGYADGCTLIVADTAKRENMHQGKTISDIGAIVEVSIERVTRAADVGEQQRQSLIASGHMRAEMYSVALWMMEQQTGVKADQFIGQAATQICAERFPAEPVQVVIVEGSLNRLEIAQFEHRELRWSGSRWVRRHEGVQISNFLDPDAAREYAQGFKFTVLALERVREIPAVPA